MSRDIDHRAVVCFLVKFLRHIGDFRCLRLFLFRMLFLRNVETFPLLIIPSGLRDTQKSWCVQHWQYCTVCSESQHCVLNVVKGHWISSRLQGLSRCGKRSAYAVFVKVSVSQHCFQCLIFTADFNFHLSDLCFCWVELCVRCLHLNQH